MDSIDENNKVVFFVRWKTSRGKNEDKGLEDIGASLLGRRNYDCD